ncbi:MAG: DUF2085 domain-containing protein [Anaerolineae bacterium]|jgi:uncharacterized membrane protein|nr:DUF2085 domain-containing protein [Chloroflexota bacterium]
MGTRGLRRVELEAVVSRFANQAALFTGRHWLLLANLALLAILAIAVGAPILESRGHPVARALYLVLAPTCHQLPERSYFLLGPSATLSADELDALGPGSRARRFTGTPVVGYKLAVCQRCLAIYVAWLVLGVGFGLFGRHLRQLRMRQVLPLIAPIAVDGVGQMIGLWSSSWPTRTVTGVLFAAALVRWAYPFIEQGMGEMVQSILHSGASQAAR